MRPVACPETTKVNRSQRGKLSAEAVAADGDRRSGFLRYLCGRTQRLNLTLRRGAHIRRSKNSLLLLWIVNRQCRMLRGVWRIYMSATVVGTIFLFRFWARLDMIGHLKFL